MYNNSLTAKELSIIYRILHEPLKNWVVI